MGVNAHQACNVSYGNELFDKIRFLACCKCDRAVSLPFTLIHDDIMDKSVFCGGMQTVHTNMVSQQHYFSGDVMLVAAMNILIRSAMNIFTRYLQFLMQQHRMWREGQLDIWISEKEENVSFDYYVQMIGLKTSVLAASSGSWVLYGGAGRATSSTSMSLKILALPSRFRMII